jgi:hypothetical protein
MSDIIMIVVGTPPDAVDAVLDAIAGAGGGVLGNYTYCGFTSAGLGRFKPNAQANPHIGEKESVNSVDEVRIETFCDRAVAKAVAAAIRKAHPYEEPVIYLIPLLSEADL